MPEHLEQVDIGAVGVSKELSSWLSTQENGYTESKADANLEKCTAEELDKRVEPLMKKAHAKLYMTVSKSIQAPIQHADCIATPSLGSLPIKAISACGHQKSPIRYSHPRAYLFLHIC